ncbi:hypothetical protein PISMIDRAFT_112320 [Pisolithus microcarpus 441]|uniref:Uncharacterized protein n=1 Tax=Pisolithus microcarpus 441 TaxID=765257 RepID=A0A0C9ZAU3_9AGAM|nr:hypothetical protein BKA83DRAFT_112320 [Pisolithus microcarpus]KIK16993.1 hypothetical protein PISMIDRAFT_112320 [Pisolithus microcarpus 441]
MGSGHVHYINGHLPSLLQEDRKWTKQVLPALVMWARSLGNPWVIPDQDLMQALQTIIITVNPNFGDLTAIHPGAPVFVLVPFSFTCNELLDGLAFLYQDLDPSKPENAYQSQFLLQLLAHTHLWPCVGCPDIPKLDTSALKEHSVKGALSLSCAAVSNIFNLVARGI